MHLFAINSKAVHDAFLKLASSFYTSYGYARLWINGRKSNNGEWMTYLTTSENLYSPANWYNTAETGPCLSVLKFIPQEPMALSGWDCSRIAFLYCEF